MKNQKQAARGSASTIGQGLRYADMTPRQKAIFLLKLAVSILSFGFIFPGLTND